MIGPRLCVHLNGNLACMDFGHLLLTQVGDRLHIAQAQPRILISERILWEMAATHDHPDVRLVMPEDIRHSIPEYAGAVLTIRAVNQTVVYRIGDRWQWDREHPERRPSLFEMDCWPAEWPD